MDAVAAVHPLHEVLLAGVVGVYHQVNAGLIDGHRVQRGQNADVLHAGVLRHRAAVAVHGQILHHVDEGDLPLKMLRHAGGSISHGLREDHGAGVLLPGLEAVVGLAGGVDQGLAPGAGTADGQLLQSSAVAAHGVPLEVSQHQHRVVIHDVFAQVILLEDFSVGDGPDHVRTLGVHQVHIKIFGPAVLLQELAMGLCVVTHAGSGVAVGGIAFHHGAADLLHHGPPELRTQEILVALLPGVDLHRHLARQLYSQGVIQFNNFLRGDLPGEIDL